MTRKQIAARRSAIIAELTRMSHDGWRDRGYVEMEKELAALQRRV
jgi:hypothetical protein